jgi:hypothetical protein
MISDDANRTRIEGHMIGASQFGLVSSPQFGMPAPPSQISDAELRTIEAIEPQKKANGRGDESHMVGRSSGDQSSRGVRVGRRIGSTKRGMAWPTIRPKTFTPK